MLQEAFTARNVAKYIVVGIVQAKITETTEDLATEYVGFEEDNTLVGIGANVVGWGVAWKLKPHTDKAVDKTADFIAAKRAKRAAKKNTEEKK